MADPQFAPPAPPTPTVTPASWDDIITSYAKKYQIDPRLAQAVAHTESWDPKLNTYNPDAVSSAGARGIMQLMPETAARHQVNLADPADNIRGGLEELRDLLNQNNNDVVLALRRYNASPQAPREVTDPYVQKVLGLIKPSAASTTASATTAPPTTPPAGPPPGPLSTYWNEATQSLRGLGSAALGLGHLGLTALTQDPRTTAKAIGNTAVDASNAVGWALEHPTDTAHTLFDTSTGRVRAAADRAAQAFEGGHPVQGVDALGHTLMEAVNVPLDLMGGLGTRASEAEADIDRGDYASGLGKATDVGLNLAGPELAGKLGVRIPLPLRFKQRLLPEAQAAVDLLQQGGVNVDLATATGNNAARALQGHAESTLLGAGVGRIAKNERQQAVAALGETIANKVHPNIVTPGEAGIALREGTGDAALDLGRRASAAYDVVDQAASDPAHLHTVQTGTAPPPFYPPGQARVPIFEPIQAPSDLRQVKAALVPIRDEIMHQMPLGQQQYSQGLQAINNVLALRDFEPIGTTEKNLGALKRAARGFEHPAFKNLAQGTAGQATRAVSDAVDAAMAQLGPQAQAALTEARATTKAKYAIEDLVADMNKEKVQAFETAVASGDRHVEGLAELARVAPQAVPQVGRAVLDKIFAHASGLEKGWGREAGAARMWESLGKETKQILYGPTQAQELDRFFLGQKMLAASANPSLTSFSISTLMSTLGLLGHNPLAAVGVQGLGGAFAALANTRGGVRLLTKGLRIPPGDTTRALAWATAAANQLHQTGDLPSQVGTRPPPPRQTQIYPTVVGASSRSIETNPEATR